VNIEENENQEVSTTTQKNKLSLITWLTILTLIGIISGTIAAVIVFIAPVGNWLFPTQKNQPYDTWRDGFKYQIGRSVNILIMGIDLVPEAKPNSQEIFAGRSDTMLLARLNAENNTVKILSIPRDTRIELPDIKLNPAKINQANVDGGSLLSAKVVSQILNNISIDRYVRISTGAFRALIDKIGGVEIFVPTDMYYIDQTQKLKIDLKKGLQTLNGSQAEQFARFRSDEKGDIGRIQRQQSLFKAVRKKISDPKIIATLPQILEEMRQYLDTNLSLEETIALVNFAVGVKQESTQMIMLPGRFSQPKEYPASYWIMNKQEKNKIVREFFTEKPSTETTETLKPQQIKIAVQNATGDSRITAKVVRYLTNQGFNNIYIIRPWSNINSETQIIAQKGDLKTAENLQKMLELGQIDPSSTGEINSDITIRIGQDLMNKLEQKK
jgi:polyisoprenyl-teichoic acid--peptidoglycan teichoic acid transferase